MQTKPQLHPHTLQFIHLRLCGWSLRRAAKAVGLSPATAWRRARKFLGPSASKRSKLVEHRLRQVVRHLIRCNKAPTFKWSCNQGTQPASERSSSSRAVEKLTQRFLRHGIDGLAPDWRARERHRQEQRDFQVTPAVTDAVEQLAGKLGSVRNAWRRFGRTRECPWRLSVFIRKQRVLPEFLRRSVRLKPVRARVWIGSSGRVYIHAAGKISTLESARHAHAAKQA